MKQVLIIACTALLFMGCETKNEVEMGFRTTLKVNAVYNARKVAKGELINATFEVENTGDYALVLSDVKGSCSCTVADFTKDPIPPGEKGYVKATVKTENQPLGALQKKVYLLANTTPPETTVSVQATVIK